METNYKNGYVVLPREEYDRMQLEIERLSNTLDNVITLSKSYDNNSIQVEYNNKLIYLLAVEQFNNHPEWHDDYVLQDSVSIWSNELAKAIKKDEEQAEEEQADD